jgi:hypothetical protein
MHMDEPLNVSGSSMIRHADGSASERAPIYRCAAMNFDRYLTQAQFTRNLLVHLARGTSATPALAWGQRA